MLRANSLQPELNYDFFPIDRAAYKIIYLNVPH